jgi:hypothetical protein
MSKSTTQGEAAVTDVLKEDLEHAPGLLVDEARDTLHTATTSEAADGGLGDALDVVAKNLAVTLSAALAEALEDSNERLKTT